MHHDHGGRREWILQLTTVEHDVGELESTDTLPVQDKDASDSSIFDIEKLRAEPPKNHC